ncbi:hypothetical protein [Xanthomonas campestris]|uniref:hypothetical protein n=1 Tax=Xanthomonas campestris TaxID=339 RepID=UPI002B23B7C2|nr:hypothetical protein [Xanthomonas campestris]MEA9656889.1 hypothetical protein [Xanthomonas campestris pv. raphani]
MNADAAKEAATAILTEEIGEYSQDLSESDTRSKLVDALLIRALGWQEKAIQREPSTDGGGYVDYLLYTSRLVFVVEAKKVSVKFNLPSTSRLRKYKIGGVLSEDKVLRSAIDQCRAYGIAKGCSFCCVTNGVQYVFFRSHSDLGIEFDRHQALIFTSPEDLLANFSLFFQLLSFHSVSEGRHVSVVPVIEADEGQSGLKVLSRDPHKARYKNRNRLFPFVRDVVREVFQDLAGQDADPDLLEQCYVESASHGSYDQSLRGLIRNKPGLGGIHPIRVERRSAGAFDKVVTQKGRRPEVVMVLGGIGAGKTTFLRRFRRVIGKESIDKDAYWIEVDFNRYSDAPGMLDDWVASEVYSQAETADSSGHFGTYAHLRQAYSVEYERLKKGRLARLYEQNIEAFDDKFAEELELLEKNKVAHVTKLLKYLQSNRGRRVILVFDNADQFPAVMQNDVFMLANRLAADISGTAIISLREESFWKNKNFGSLSAFHVVSYYVEVPDLKRVIAKRMRYASELLRRSDYVVPSGGQVVTLEEGIGVFESIRSTVVDDPQFIRFLRDLSPGEVRRPLDQLARFLYSGHTNVDSLLRGFRSRQKIQIGFHEFFKSIAISDREYFSEESSDILNIFASHGGSDSSNLNRLAVLGLIHSYRRMSSERGVGYVQLAKVVDICMANGLTDVTTYSIIQLMNERRLVESEEQVRENILPSVYVRTTDAFDYYVGHLCSQFAYIDLVIPGSTMPAGMDYDMIERLSSQIYQVGVLAPNRIDKLQLRIDRARLFAQSMQSAMEAHSLFRQNDLISDGVRSFVNNLDLHLERQSAAILDSAKKAFSRHSK